MNQDPAASIRQAVAREDYALALTLWNAYAAETRSAAERGELTPAEMGRFGQLFEWASAVLRAARAHVQVQLNMTHSAAAYLTRQVTSGRIRASL